MANFYKQILTLVKKSIAKYGRPIKIRRKTASDLEDPNKPWIPAEPTLTEYDVVGVFIEESGSFSGGHGWRIGESLASIDGLQTTLQNATRSVLLAGDVLSTPPDPSDIIIDGADEKIISRVVSVAPGDFPVLFICVLEDM